jgi:drug/metabolite transporter (DMT)-like permease
MIPAFLATLLFSISVVAASRTTRVLGGTTANFVRLCLATLFLALWAHGFGQGFGGGAMGWFFLSGMIGFGLGDLALYQALPRIGPRLTILLVQCLAAPFAALAEWIWMETTLTWKQMGLAVVILAGVAIAVAPQRRIGAGRHDLVIGVLLGVVGALGQGLGAVVSRQAYAVAALHPGEVDGLTAAYQRILGGLILTAPFMFWLMYRDHLKARERMPRLSAVASSRRSPIWPWVVLNSLSGPTLGVGCYQWALSIQPSGIVLPIVATTPVVVIPFAWLMEGDKPSLRSLIGGFIAVAGAVLLAAGVV